MDMPTLSSCRAPFLWVFPPPPPRRPGPSLPPELLWEVAEAAHLAL